jgi:ribosomal protein L7/L12
MMISKEMGQQIELLLSQNRKVEAIKLVLDTTHCGLKNAKDFVIINQVIRSLLQSLHPGII